MFTSFFFLLRARGLNVSLDEWLTLLTALNLGLHRFSLSGFYALCRATLIKSEADYDKFDLAFMEFFREVTYQSERELPEDLLNWLSGPELEALSHDDVFKTLLENPGVDMDEVLKRFEELLKEQDAEHNGGSKWIGRNGYSPYGNNGKRLGGIRVGGASRNRSAFMVAGERKFRDFRNDTALNLRQFQVAFRKLRQLSEQASDGLSELDTDHTIEETGKQAGMLHIVYKRPRKNSIRVMLLIDSGGSMDYYARLSSTLFQAAVKSNIFKDLKTYYFHNCIYDYLFPDPTMRTGAIKTEDVLQMVDSDYRVIIVGDAMMAPEELYQRVFHWGRQAYSEKTGLQRLRQFKERYPHIIWLNPQPRNVLHAYWAQTYDYLAQEFNMFDLSLSGLEEGIRHLLGSKH